MKDSTTTKKAVGSSGGLGWHVEINSMSCIVFAESKPKARWIAVKSYWEAGFGRRRAWPRPTVWRAEQYDNSPLRDHFQRAWSEEHVKGKKRHAP